MYQLNIFCRLFAVLLLLTGCSSRIDGEVFIVTNAGESKKLALVDVNAYKIVDLDGFKRSLLADLSVFIKFRASTLLSSPNPVLSLDTDAERKLFSQHVAQSVRRLTKDSGLPVVRSQSDAEGRFQMDLPAGEYLIIAVGARQALSEEYIWLMKAPNNGKLRLANDSMYDKGCDLCFLSKNDLKLISDERDAALVEIGKELDNKREERRRELLLKISPEEINTYNKKDCNELKIMAAAYPNSTYAEQIEAYILKRWGSTTCL